MIPCYLDNDALHKLAALDLVQELLNGLGAQVRVLPTAKYKFFLQKEAKGRSKFGSEVWERIRDVLEVALPVETPAQERMDSLTHVYGIDQGEALLLAAAAEDHQSVVVTGDKRSLEALHGHGGSQELVAKLAGRVLSLEQAIRLLIRSLGLETVQARYEAAKVHDTTLAVIFGSSRKTAEHVDEGLVSYIDDLRSKTGALLRPDL